MNDEAGDCAVAAARAAGVTVRVLDGLGVIQAASGLFAEIWRPTDPVPYEMLHALAFAGNYVAGAFDGDDLIGAALGFFDADGSLHSHICAVIPRSRGGAGFAIKLHQRAWALERGISVITWTFDPLVRRNAYFNLAKLAARVRGYTEDFYGDMSDELNAGDPSDRLIVEWHLGDPAVTAAAGGSPRLPGEAGHLLLTEDPSGTPRLDTFDTGNPPARLMVAAPSDIAALRAQSPGQARSWRRAQRAAFATAFGGGYAITGFTRPGSYVLEAAK